MQDHPSRFALTLALAAALFGIAGDTLFRAAPWGLNAALWIGGLIVAALVLEFRFRSGPRSWSHKALLGVAFLFALSFAWRDSPTLKFLSGAMVLACMAVVSGLVQGAFSFTRIRVAHVISVFAGLVQSPLVLTPRWLRLARSWIGEREKETHVPALGVARGLLIATPLVFVFGGLFASADPLFERMAVRLFDFDLANVLSHTSLSILCGWIAATLLVLLVVGLPRVSEFKGVPALKSGGFVELKTVLLMVDLLFLVFVVVQAPYFFGGHERVLAESGLTYSEYARRGFFELVVVAALAFSLLLTLNHLISAAPARDTRAFRILAHALVLLTGVVIASALDRMNLYRDVYGLTELRLYVTAFIVWLAFAFVWLSLTLLRGRDDRLVPGMLASGLAAALCLIAINPDAVIVRTNLQRAAAGWPLDVEYATQLSADAVPDIVNALPSLPRYERRRVEQALQARWTSESFEDGRAWSWGRGRARRALMGMADPT